MSDAMWKKLLGASLVVVVIGMFVGNGTFSIGQEAKAAKKAKGRLPPYFADIVTDEQRNKIYEVQMKYAKERDALEAQLEELRSIEMGEIEGLLDAEQKEKLKKAREEAAAKRKRKANTDAAAAETKPTEEKPAATTVKPKKAG
jgi:hypothetical protein